MFRLNQAPNSILSAMNVHEVKRGCGSFWSIACCVPTCGFTVIGDNTQETGNWLGCCYPTKVNLESDVTLKVLREKLNQLRISKIDLENKVDFDENKLIEWQVKETLLIVKKALNDNII